MFCNIPETVSESPALAFVARLDCVRDVLSVLLAWLPVALPVVLLCAVLFITWGASTRSRRF